MSDQLPARIATPVMLLAVLFLTARCSSPSTPSIASGYEPTPTRAVSTAIPSEILTLTPLPTLNAPPSDAMALLTDTSHAVSILKTFGISIDEVGPDLGWHGSWLTSVYGTPLAIPIVQGKLVTFIRLDKVDEYQQVDGLSVIILHNGQRLSGYPLTEAKFTGENALGQITLAQQKVESVKFNAQQVKTLFPKDAYGWPNDYTVAADVTLDSGDVLSLHALVLVYQQNGCDDSWIPCKPYTIWQTAVQDIPITYGEAVTKIDLAKVQSMDVSVVNPGSYSNYQVQAKMVFQSGDKVTTVIGDSGQFRVRALLGTTDIGYVHVPIEDVKSVLFK